MNIGKSLPGLVTGLVSQNSFKQSEKFNINYSIKVYGSPHLGFFSTVWGTSWMTWNSRLSSFAANSTGSFDSVDWPSAATARENPDPCNIFFEKKKRRIALWVTLVDLLFYFFLWIVLWRLNDSKDLEIIENAIWLTPGFLTATHRQTANLPAHLRCLHGSVRTNTSRILPEKFHENPASKKTGLVCDVSWSLIPSQDSKSKSNGQKKNPLFLWLKIHEICQTTKNSSRNINGTTINTHSPKRALAKSDTKTVIMMQWYPFCVGRIFRPPPVLRSTRQREWWDHSFTDLTDDSA